VARPRTHDETLQRQLLETAAQILAAGGPPALNLRTLARAAGTSTSAVYSLFGGKSALLRAIYAEGFARLSRRLAAVEPSDDPAEDLVQLGLAYRASALQSPRLYPVMFGQSPAGLEPGEPGRGAGREALGLLAAAVTRGVRAGVFPAGSERRLTLAAWALAHGLVSLELNGLLPGGGSAEADYERILRDTVGGWQDRG